MPERSRAINGRAGWIAVKSQAVVGIPDSFSTLVSMTTQRSA